MLKSLFLSLGLLIGYGSAINCLSPNSTLTINQNCNPLNSTLIQSYQKCMIVCTNVKCNNITNDNNNCTIYGGNSLLVKYFKIDLMSITYVMGKKF